MVSGHESDVSRGCPECCFNLEWTVTVQGLGWATAVRHVFALGWEKGVKARRAHVKGRHREKGREPAGHPEDTNLGLESSILQIGPDAAVLERVLGCSVCA